LNTMPIETVLICSTLVPKSLHALWRHKHKVVAHSLIGRLRGRPIYFKNTTMPIETLDSSHL
jgi:hypothetical protein